MTEREERRERIYTFLTGKQRKQAPVKKAVVQRPTFRDYMVKNHPSMKGMFEEMDRERVLKEEQYKREKIEAIKRAKENLEGW